MAINLNNYTALYEQAASLIPHGSKVVEFGCGTGEFSRIIAPKCKHYFGYDIDKQSIEKATKIASTRPALRHYDAVLHYYLEDITHEKHDWSGVNTYVALEVFEHLNGFEDLELLSSLGKGSRVIISVPSFDSEGHKRFFPEEWEAINRYHDHFDIDLWRKIALPTGGGYFHLIRGFR